MGEAGLSDVGAVTGATAPERLEALRALMPHAVWLLPGIGPQGGSGRDLAPAFAPGPAGGLVSASRAIVYAFERGGGGRGSGGMRARRGGAAARAHLGHVRLTTPSRDSAREGVGAASMIALGWWLKSRASWRRSHSLR